MWYAWLVHIPFALLFYVVRNIPIFFHFCSGSASRSCWLSTFTTCFYFIGCPLLDSLPPNIFSLLIHYSIIQSSFFLSQSLISNPKSFFPPLNTTRFRSLPHHICLHYCKFLFHHTRLLTNRPHSPDQPWPTPTDRPPPILAATRIHLIPLNTSYTIHTSHTPYTSYTSHTFHTSYTSHSPPHTTFPSASVNPSYYHTSHLADPHQNNPSRLSPSLPIYT